MDKDVNIYFKVEGLDGYITNLDDLQKALGKVETATKEVAGATEELETAADNFDALESKLDATEGAVKVLAGSFEVLAGAASLLGLENNEFFRELEENVVGVIALAEGAVNVSEGYKLLAQSGKLAAVQQRILNAVTAANPYVLLAGAVIAAAAAIGGYLVKSMEAKKEEEERRKEIVKTTAELRKKNIEEQAGILERRKLRQISKSDDVQALKEQGQAAKDEAANLESLIDYQERQLLLIENRNKEDFKGYEAQKRQEEARQKIIERIKEFNEELEAQQVIVDATNSRIEELTTTTEENTAVVVDNTNTRKEALDALEAYIDGTALALQQDLQEWQDYYDKRKEQEYDWNMAYDQFIADRMDADERDRANKDRLAQLEENRDRMLQDSKFALADATVEAGKFAATMVERFGKDEEKAAKAAFVVNKLAAIADVIIQYQKAKIGLLASSSTLPPVAREAYLAKSLLAARISSGISLATILATKFGGGGNLNEGPSPSAAGGASINYNFGQEAGGTIQPGQLSTGQQAGPQQVYVLASDVTNAQQAQQQINNLAKL